MKCVHLVILVILQGYLACGKVIPGEELSAWFSNYTVDYITPTSPFEIAYEWKTFEFEYPSEVEQSAALNSKEYIPLNILPLGIDVWQDRLFLTTPRWKNGVPASLSALNLLSYDKSPSLTPYPNWDAQSTSQDPDCSKLFSVFRIDIDECGRLWAIDVGKENIAIDPKQVCPPKIVVFDLTTDQHLFTYTIPEDQVKDDSTYYSILVDIKNGQCDDAHAYVADTGRSGLLVFSLGKWKSWRTSHHFMLPNPYACEHNYNNEIFYQWDDGIFGIALGLKDANGDRLLYFHPMSSFDEFSVPTSILQNETIWTEDINVNAEFKLLGFRGLSSQSCTSATDRDGVLFYTLVDQNAIGCWDTRKPLVAKNIHNVDKNKNFFTFPVDLKVDKDVDQSVWVITNKLPVYTYGTVDYTQVNIRIFRANVKEAVQNSICDPMKPE